MDTSQEYTPYSLLTPWSRVLLEKLNSLQLVKTFPTFYGTQRYITTFTSAHHLFLSWASSMQNDILTTIKVWSAHLFHTATIFLNHIARNSFQQFVYFVCTDAGGEHLCQWCALYAGWCGQKGERRIQQ